jgi:hypothetical protein
MTAIDVLITILISLLFILTVTYFSLRTQRQILSLKFAFLVLLLALVFSSLSGFFSQQQFAGTGIHTSYGYPRSFYFKWHSLENSEQHEGLNILYFLENWLVYTAVFSVFGTVSIAIATKQNNS